MISTQPKIHRSTINYQAMPKPSTDPPEKGKEDTNIAHRTRNASRRDSSGLKDPAAMKKLEKEKRDHKQKPKPDYIPPLRRNLGPYASVINPPLPTSLSLDPVDFEFRKFVGLIVKSTPNSPGFTQEFVDELSDLSTTYINHLITQLHKYTETQRHRLAGVTDLQMCLDNNGVSTSELYGEYERTLQLSPEVRSHASGLRNRLSKILQQYNAEHYNLEKDDPSLVFHANEQYEIAALVPRQSEPKTYIPGYFPDLPPDFTYQNTGSYMNTITDLKQIKLKLVEESRLNEKSLYKLIEDDDTTWMATLEEDLDVLNSSDLDTDQDDIMSVSGDKNATDIESPTAEHAVADLAESNKHDNSDGPVQDTEMIENEEPVTATITSTEPENESIPQAEPKTDVSSEVKVAGEITESAAQLDVPEIVEVDPTPDERPPAKSDARFDFVEYARKRRLAKQRELRAIEKRRHKRLRNIFMRAEKVFSCYASSAPKLEEVEYFKTYLDNGFKKVILATRLAEKEKKQRLAELQKEKAAREHEQEQKNGSIEFGFTFNPGSNLLDDSDDDDEDGDKEVRDIIFEDHDEQAEEPHGQVEMETPVAPTADPAESDDDMDLENIFQEIEQPETNGVNGDDLTTELHTGNIPEVTSTEQPAASLWAEENDPEESDEDLQDL